VLSELFNITSETPSGSRFALLEIKILFYYMLLNFSFEPTDKTEIPIKLNTAMSTFYPKDGIQIEFRLRNQ
jgi:cytochrome P450 family 9